MWWFTYFKLQKDDVRIWNIFAYFLQYFLKYVNIFKHMMSVCGDLLIFKKYELFFRIFFTKLFGKPTLSYEVSFEAFRQRCYWDIRPFWYLVHILMFGQANKSTSKWICCAKCVMIHGHLPSGDNFSIVGKQEHSDQFAQGGACNLED